MPNGLSIDYVTPAQFVDGLKPTQGKVVTANWSTWTWNVNYCGLIDLATNNVYATYAEASAAGARRLWRCWLKAHADILIPYLESSDFGTVAGENAALTALAELSSSFGEYGEPEGNHATYLMPAACLGIGLALDGTTSIYRPEGQYESARYFQYAIVTKDDKTQAWANDDLVYVKAAKTGVGVIATKTVISGAPAFRVYASAANIEYAQIKTMNGNSRGHEAARPTELESLAVASQYGYTLSGFLQQNAVVVNPYGCIGGTFQNAVLGMHGTQELLLFYDWRGGTDGAVANTFSANIFLQFRTIDSRSQMETVYNEQTETYYDVLTETRWLVAVAPPSILPLSAFIETCNSSSVSTKTYARRNVPHHALAINMPGSITFSNAQGDPSEACPSMATYDYQIAFVANEPSAKPGSYGDTGLVFPNVNASFPMMAARIVTVAGESEQTVHQCAAHTPSPVIGQANARAPYAHFTGAVLASVGGSSQFATRGGQLYSTVYGALLDTMWSRRVDQLSSAGFHYVVGLVQDNSGDPYPVSAHITFISPEGQGINGDWRKLTDEYQLPFMSIDVDPGGRGYDVTKVGIVGSLPPNLSSTDIYPYFVKVRIVWSDSTEYTAIDGWTGWVAVANAAKFMGKPPSPVDRAPWIYDIMPGKYPVIGTENKSHIATVYHKGKAIELAENVDAPTWSAGNVIISAERINYTGDQLKPALVIRIKNPTSSWPTFPDGYQPQYGYISVSIGGDCYQDRGGAFDAGIRGEYYIYKTNTLDQTILFATQQWPLQTDQHTWHVPDSGTVFVRVRIRCAYVSRKHPTGVTEREFTAALDIPEPLST